MDKIEAYLEKEKEVVSFLRSAIANRERNISLVPKKTTHIMRRRAKKSLLNLKEFNQIIKINPEKQEVEVEGCTRFYDIVKETLKYGLMPKVVPEFRGITIGGTVSGLGLESSSFKYGIVQETLKNITLLTGSGEVVTCSSNLHSDLFNALPNSFGSLGYVLKCTASLVDAKKYVRVTVLKFSDAPEYFERVNLETANSQNDFIDGAIFSGNEYVLVLGVMVNSPPENTKLLDLVANVYYERLKRCQNNENLYLGILDYLFRWDRDAFWGIESYPTLKKIFRIKLLRMSILRPFLRTDRLLTIKRVADRISDVYNSAFSKNPIRFEELIQDFGIDIQKAAEFMNWYNKELSIYPLWICPLKKMASVYPLFDFNGDMIIDIGFYAKTLLDDEMAGDHYLLMGERKLHKMGGMKGLYSRNTYTLNEFWNIYNKEEYFRAKNKYDPKATFPDVYKKISTS